YSWRSGFRPFKQFLEFAFGAVTMLAVKCRPVVAVLRLPDYGRCALWKGASFSVLRVPWAKKRILFIVGVGQCCLVPEPLEHQHQVKAGKVSAELEMPGEFLFRALLRFVFRCREFEGGLEPLPTNPRDFPGARPRVDEVRIISAIPDRME